MLFDGDKAFLNCYKLLKLVVIDMGLFDPWTFTQYPNPSYMECADSIECQRNYFARSVLVISF